MPGIDYDRLRREITMVEVLNLLGLAGGTDNFGSLLQFSGLTALVAAFISTNQTAGGVNLPSGELVLR